MTWNLLVDSKVTEKTFKNSKKTAAMKHYFLSTKMNKIKITDITNISEDGEYRDSQTLLVGT